MGYGRHPAQAQGDALFQPLECEPTLQIGYAVIVDSIIYHFTVLNTTLVTKCIKWFTILTVDKNSASL